MQMPQNAATIPGQSNRKTDPFQLPNMPQSDLSKHHNQEKDLKETTSPVNVVEERTRSAEKRRHPSGPPSLQPVLRPRLSRNSSTSGLSNGWDSLPMHE